MNNQIDLLKERILNKKGKGDKTKLTDILDLVREFSCLGEIIGRDFEVKDKDGKLIYTIHQKPITISQLNVIFKEFATLKKLDAEREAAKWNGKGGKKIK
jgi:hypothetical protein